MSEANNVVLYDELDIAEAKLVDMSMTITAVNELIMYMIKELKIFLSEVTSPFISTINEE